MAAAIVYEDFEPYCKWQREEERDVLQVEVTGFKKDQVKIQVSDHGLMIIAGERQLEGKKRSRFKKELNLPESYKSNGIHAKLSGGILSIFMPKKAPSSSPANQENEREKQKTVGDTATTQIPKTSKLSRSKFRLPDDIVSKLGIMKIAVAFSLVVAVGAFFVMYKYRRFFCC